MSTSINPMDPTNYKTLRPPKPHTFTIHGGSATNSVESGVGGNYFSRAISSIKTEPA